MTATPATRPRATPLDVDALRRRFPALERREGGHPVAYFDGPGGTQVPAEVADAMRQYLLHHNANTHWAYPTSQETDEILSGARAALADFTGGAPEEIAFGANMTTLTFHLARALARGWKAGDEVVVTELDHHANVAPWEAVSRERGVVLRTVPFDPASGELDWAGLERALGARTRLLAIGAASNALGTVTDVARAAALAHALDGMADDLVREQGVVVRVGHHHHLALGRRERWGRHQRRRLAGERDGEIGKRRKCQQGLVHAVGEDLPAALVAAHVVERLARRPGDPDHRAEALREGERLVDERALGGGEELAAQLGHDEDVVVVHARVRGGDRA